MGKNYNFDLQPKKVDDQTIRKYQDFDQLLATFEREAEQGANIDQPFALEANAPTRRRLLYWLTPLATAAAIAAFLLFRPSQVPIPANEWLPAEQAYFSKHNFVRPPLPKVEAHLVNNTVDAKRGGTYQLSNQMQVIVPADAFVDRQGQPVTGEVAIRYRELRDPVDFFLSGIPLHYDSAGTRYQLESTGMLEIYGYLDDRPVQLAPGKSIRIELESVVRSKSLEQIPVFNIYELDTVQRNWQYRAIDQVQWAEDEPFETNLPTYERTYRQQILDLDRRIADQRAELEEIFTQPMRPVAPPVYDGTSPTFDLKFTDDLLDESSRDMIQLANPDGIWQILPGQDYDERALAVVWESVQVDLVKPGIYRMLFISGTNNFELKVSPVLTGRRLEEAKNRFEQEQQIYQEALATWQAEVDKAYREIVDSLNQQKAIATEIYQNYRKEDLDAQINTYRRTIVNSFELTAFGTWSCSRLLQPGEEALVLSLEDQFGNAYTNHTAYLIDKTQNTVYRFYAGKQTLLRLNPNNDHVLWVVTDDQQLAVQKGKRLEEQLNNNTARRLELNLNTSPVESKETVRQLLEL